jgi:hypothetical protein
MVADEKFGGERTFLRLRLARPSPGTCQSQRRPGPHFGVVFHERDVCRQAASTLQRLDACQQEGGHGFAGDALCRGLGERLPVSVSISSNVIAAASGTGVLNTTPPARPRFHLMRMKRVWSAASSSLKSARKPLSRV